MQLLLARHGETEMHNTGRYVGSQDPPLSATGRLQAHRLADVLPPGVSRCLCSPMLRARETAELTLADYPCQTELLDSLREVDFGRWEGLTFSEIAAQDPALIADWQRDPLAFQFPGGERTLSFWQRVQEALTAITSLPDDVVLLICHGGVIRVMLCSLLGIPFEKYLLFAVKPAALTRLDVVGHRGVLQYLNR
ncbi:MAG: histidine phosphatase family protein [Desulfobulbaceae bacterium]|nr:histidine phosphatase family protein [Desulfobulbaceae bacterium]